MNIEAPRFRILNLEQDSDDWLKWRRCGIGATDYYSLESLKSDSTGLLALQKRLEKAGIVRPLTFPPKIAEAAERGKRLEPEAREVFNARFGYHFKPVCIELIQDSRIRCSLDGLDERLRTTLEIKCLTDKQHTASYSAIRDKYKRQIEYQLWITGYDFGMYWGYHPEMEPVFRIIYPNSDTEERIHQLMAVLKMPPDARPAVIGIFGYARSGKSTLQNIIEMNYGYQKINFADALKEECIEAGILSENFTEEEKVAKRNEIIAYANKRRSENLLYYNEKWFERWRAAGFPRVVIGDCRFIHEYLLLKNLSRNMKVVALWLDRDEAVPSAQELQQTSVLREMLPRIQNESLRELELRAEEICCGKAWSFV